MAIVSTTSRKIVYSKKNKKSKLNQFEHGYQLSTSLPY